MSWSFDGTNDYGTAAANLSGSPLVTVACWFYWDAYANDDDLLMEYGTTNYAVSNGFIIDPNSNSFIPGNFAIGFYTTNDVWYYFTRPSAATWHHLMVTIDKNTATAGDKIKAWIDGTAQSMTIAANLGASGGSLGNTTLYAMCRNTSSLFGAGDLAELALWSGTLLDTSHALMMAKGYAPTMIGLKPTHYWPLIGNTTSEYNPTGGVTMSITGATKAAHPAIKYEAPRIGRRYKPAAAATRVVKMAGRWGGYAGASGGFAG